ncbi:MAG: hypothetical protein EOO40_11050, partial [Deltaproteobacteria bacterium]
MEHGITWFSFLPGYAALEALLQSHFVGVLGNPPVLQHVFAALLVALILMVVSTIIRLDLGRAGENAVVPSPNITTRNMVEVALEALYSQSRQ